MMTPQQESFLKTAGAAAQYSAKQYRVPASITLAQAILESGWGQSQLALKANNYFGIKAVQGQEYVSFRTTEFIKGIEEHPLANFARYENVTETFLAHAKLLSTLPRYAPAMKVATDPASFASAITTCGYSTDPDYPKKLMALVTEYNLTQFDSAPLGAVPAMQAKS